ncbi:MAG: hypothetical protein EOP45_16670 [Sphingobacteriaceae bacterium]|nr:MAG: hypothetical protein EOP45_16670 [Sphingobacteriaceae bacterium]
MREPLLEFSDTSYLYEAALHLKAKKDYAMAMRYLEYASNLDETKCSLLWQEVIDNLKRIIEAFL